MKEAALIIIKPDGIRKQLVGGILTKFASTGLQIVGLRMVKTSRALAREHYKHLKTQPFFNQIVSYLAGEYHNIKKLIAIVYYGQYAIKKCRKVAGATNPNDAQPDTVRGAYGRIVASSGLFENVVHVSSTAKEAEREIKLWFSPDDILTNLYPTKTIVSKVSKKVWA